MSSLGEQIERVSEENEIGHPLNLLAGLMALLHEHHRLIVGSGAPSRFDDGLDSITGQHAGTLAESIRNWARAAAAFNFHNSKNNRESSDTSEDQQNREYYSQQSEAELIAARRFKALADLLDYYIPVWSADGSYMRQSFDMLSIQMRKRAPDDDPPSEHPSNKPRM